MTSIHDLHLIKTYVGNSPIFFNSLVGILTSRELNYVGSADIVNQFFGMPTIHDKQVGMERPTISEISSAFTSSMPNADLN